MPSIEEILGMPTLPSTSAAPAMNRPVSKIEFSFLFFSDVRKDVSDREKYDFMRDITLFGDREGFSAVYIPERHFSEFGSIYANSAIMASHLIPQTKRIRFRTAGVSLPLHHPAEVVEWWAMNDILSGGRVDLGFGSGWNKADFIFAPQNYENRKQICLDQIPVIKKLWRGESVTFSGADGKDYPITVYPRPHQKELNVWLLGTSDDTYIAAGKLGYNIFTMLQGISLDGIAKKVKLYREARSGAGFDADSGIFSLMLHTFVHPDKDWIMSAVEKPFKEYIKSSLGPHLAAGLEKETAGMRDGRSLSGEEKEKIVDYAFQRYFGTAAMFGNVEQTSAIVDKAIQAGVNDIACLVDFGIDYDAVRDSLPYLQQLVKRFR
ncbi:natural product biosynthesis luciferase-like monooxygenase domain containing protein [Herbaspirillum sp. CF444]|uniref:MupA/Atu3671 family FMN-dependent luciferase-like monooxygenase n=1 Tax=Herbaspirillum sp. CF444 TaxID=1144319 RepID=UPI00027262D9|nr:MupA/Atu3671 family FMN-dependent luciferase-like monooxygenase [Herbaspirillum sp. CF444]EJL94062.1 natural product biosynthesis luciferase-like monooxygenase domain containing protein [Herbaspirillum sp. CF444]